MYNQSGVLPYKIVDGKIQILLITSIKKKRWIIPKGYVDYNMSPFESAKKEAFEEAGIVGSNETIEIGTYTKNNTTDGSTVKIFSMHVEDLLEDYPEKELRRRAWLDIEDAIKIVENESLREIIKKFDSMFKSPKNNS